MGDRKALEFCIVLAIALTLLLMVILLLRNARGHRDSAQQERAVQHQERK